MALASPGNRDISEFLPISDGVIVLDRLSEDDVAHHIANTPDDSMVWWPPESGEEAVREWLRRDNAGWQERRRDRCVAVRANGILVGGLEIRGLDAPSAHISYWTYPAHRRLGYARRAVVLAADVLLRAHDISTVQLRIRTANTASLALARSLGFVEAERHGDEILFYRASPTA